MERIDRIAVYQVDLLLHERSYNCWWGGKSVQVSASTVVRVETESGLAGHKGYPYAQSSIDIACWDLFRQIAGLPVVALLGGRYSESFVRYRAISYGGGRPPRMEPT